MKKLLILTSDLRDMVLLCGGTAARFSSEGNEVHAVFVHEQQSDVSDNVCRIMGMTSCTHLDLPKPLEIAPGIADRLASIFRQVRPDIILTYSKHSDLSHPSRSAVREYAMTAYQTASGAGYRDDREVSPRQTPFFGLCGSCEQPDIYLSIDCGADAKAEAARLLGADAETVRAKASADAEACRPFRSSPCRYAEPFTSFAATAKTGKFIW